MKWLLSLLISGTRAQTIDSNGHSVPLLLADLTSANDFSLSTFAEDPATGDRVYGGKIASNAFIGFKTE